MNLHTILGEDLHCRVQDKSKLKALSQLESDDMPHERTTTAKNREYSNIT
jgi:hypothetical protein